MANKIHFKKGLRSVLPPLEVGEPGFCTDTGEFFIGSAGGNIPFAKSSEVVDYTKMIPYGGTTTGIANTYVISAPAISALVAGMAVSVKINISSTDASTLNWNAKGAKSIKKPNGTNATNLIAGGIYTLRYDGTNFILQGEGGSGNAIASDLLSGKTASVDAGDIIGTMVDRGTVNITPSTINQAITAGKHSGSGVVYGDPDLIIANIKAGANIFGVIGKTSVVDTADATAIAANILETKTGYVNGSLITGAMPNNASQTITLTTNGSTKVVPSGYTPGGTITASMTNLTAATVLKGQTVGGVVGTATADATAVANDLRSGKSAYVNGIKVNGSLTPSNLAYSTTAYPSQENGYTFITAEIPPGLYGGGGPTRGVSPEIEIEDVDNGFYPDAIRTGIRMFGVDGTFSHIQSIQRGSTLMEEWYDTYVQIPISAVDLTSSIVRINGITALSETSKDGCRIVAALETSSRIAISRLDEMGDIAVEWDVITFNGVKSLQRGTLNQASLTTLLISSVNISKSILFYSYSAYGSDKNNEISLRLGDATHLHFTNYGTGSRTINWQLIEFN